MSGIDLIEWRGLFIPAVEDFEEAKKLTATDPVIIKGEDPVHAKEGYPGVQ